jgi:hypothetical protein
MFEQVKVLLASSDPATLIGSAAVAVFLLILGWRKFFPASWNWLELRIPLIDRIQSNALWTFTWKAVQALPGALFGALMVALASGGDIKKTLLGALAGPAAAIGHEILKRYKGQTGKPGSRSLPPPPFVASAFIGAALGCVLALALSGCALFGANSPLWPIVTKCLPSPASIISDVTNILFAGGDYESALLVAGETHGKNAIVCAVREIVDKWGKPGISDAERARIAPAYGRARAFLAKTENAK